MFSALILPHANRRGGCDTVSDLLPAERNGCIVRNVKLRGWRSVFLRKVGMSRDTIVGCRYEGDLEEYSAVLIQRSYRSFQTRQGLAMKV